MKMACQEEKWQQNFYWKNGFLEIKRKKLRMKNGQV